jgi:antitoxin YefM
MDVVSLAEARRRLARLMDQAEANREPIVISRHGKQAAVMLSLVDYNNLMEMVHLVRSPRNAVRLRRSVRGAQRVDALGSPGPQT